MPTFALVGELFYSLKEAKIVMEQCHHYYTNYYTIRPHSSLDYRSPAPAAGSPQPFTLE